MRKSLSAFLVTVFIFSLAQTSWAQKARSRAVKRVEPNNSTAPVESVRRNPRNSALRKVGIVSLLARDGVTPEQAAALTRQLINDLTALSYIEAAPLTGPIDRASRPTLAKNMADSGLDGALIGVVSVEGVQASLLSRGGEVLANLTLSRDVSLANESQIKLVSRLMVDEIARAVPYRGFVTRKTPEGLYEINLGKNQGILKGQRFRLFDFSGSSFASQRQDLGEAEVVEVGDSTSLIESRSGSEDKLFAKVGFNENARGMSVAQEVQTRGYALAGGGLLNISGTADPKYIDRAYNVSSTPGFILGGGWNKYRVDFLFAQARGDDTDLLYNELILNDQIVDVPFGGLNRFSVGLGARIARVNITTKRNVASPLQSTTSVSPAVELRLDRVIKGPVRGFISANGYYPIFVSGMDTGALFFSYAVGGNAGLSFDFSQRMFFDVGLRYHVDRRPVEAQSAVTETYTETFADLGYRF